jgi:hypothetical protein
MPKAAIRASRGIRGRQTGSKRLKPFRSSTIEATHRRAKGPHEQIDFVPFVVHLATLEVVCHAGGCGFESRRSRFCSLAAKRHFLLSC